jgi:protease I
MKALILTGRMVQDKEADYPGPRLQEAGYDVDVAAEKTGEFFGIEGGKFRANKTINEIGVDDYDLLIIPGGVKCMEHLRLDKKAVQFVAEFHASGKVIGSICSGAQMLISAKLCKGRHISAYYAMRDDVENAGAIFVDAPAVVCENIVTSPHYDHRGIWMKAVLDAAGGNIQGTILYGNKIRDVA